jgi:hypothetical protein
MSTYVLPIEYSRTQTQTMTNVGEDVGEREPSCNVVKNVN